MSEGAAAWFEARALVRQFPLRFRFLAWYCRLICNRTSGVVRGGSLLQRMLVRATRVLRLSDTVSITLGQATGSPGRVFLKLDVEGGDLAFLRGAERMTRARRPVILFEINPDSARAGGYGVGDLLDKVSELMSPIVSPRGWKNRVRRVAAVSRTGGSRTDPRTTTW